MAARKIKRPTIARRCKMTKRRCKRGKKKTCYAPHDPIYSKLRKLGIKPITLTDRQLL